MEPDLVRPERSAHASIRGYLYQCCLGALRWLKLGDGEVLVCEGDEDLDRYLLDGRRFSEQVKDLEAAVSIRHRAVIDSLRQFLLTYVVLRRRGEARRFVFTSTAALRRQQRRGLETDVLASWTDPELRPRVIGDLRRRLPVAKGNKGHESLTEAMAWLDDNDAWNAFVDAVEWKLGQPDLSDVRQEIGKALAGRPEELPDGELMTDRLVAGVIETSSRKDVAERQLTQRDLTDLLRQAEEDLAAWSRKPRALRLRRVFDELALLRRIVHDPRIEDWSKGELGPGRLLSAAYEVIPFEDQGRRDDLAALAAWCDREEVGSVLLLTGEGGMGKTRLLIEWCQRLEHQGWIAGFVRPGFLDRVPVPGDLEPLFEGTVPRLAVIDYAETRSPAVFALLQRLAAVKDGPKVRLALVARKAGDWWQSFPQRDEAVTHLLAVRSPPPRPLGGLAAEEEDRRTAFRRAADAFAAAVGRPPPEVVAPSLASPELERALYLHMAALAAVHGQRIDAAAAALAWAVEHERRFWDKQIRGLRLDEPAREAVEEAMAPAVASFTLAGGAADKNEALALVTAVAGDRLERADLRRGLVRLLRRLYAGAGGRYLAGLEPDLLGEELVAEQLGRDPGLLARFFDAAGETARRQGLTVLTRLAARREAARDWLAAALGGRLGSLGEAALAVAVETGDPIGRVLAQTVEAEADFEVAGRLMGRCNQDDYWQSMPLGEIALAATRKCLDHRKAEWTDPDDTQALELAGLADWLGIRLSLLGRREEALEATRESLKWHRQLAESGSEASLHDLSTSLNNLSNWLSDLGRQQESLEASREAVGLLRRLARSRPDAFLSYLGRSLTNLGATLNHLGRRREAIGPAQEATEILRQLAASQRDEFLPDLALCLNNLGVFLSELGQRKEALRATREAVELRRRLAASRPDVFLPDLAGSLNNLGGDLSELGRHEEALEPIYEAVRIRRRLAASRPEVFEPDLAASLASLGNRLGDLGRSEEALNLAEEAVRRLAPVFGQYPRALDVWMGGMVRDYRRHAEAAGQEPDEQLLAPIEAVLETLKVEENAEDKAPPGDDGDCGDDHSSRSS